ncbi:MAG: bifunctional histidinol-phosphatase/imidazoleglycerol-phosphate dehydratase HisB [Bacteroidota bacterium]|nr:bifunctional histidinol-phosphatase/imidazoleglycerol-phosphate dehydratase HisB [Bacteroidota bacterium]
MSSKKRVLFIDRDGSLIKEPPVDFQVDSLEKLEFYPGVFRNLYYIRQKLDFVFAMVTNQDGLGTASFPEETFWPAQNKMLQALENEGITFDAIHIDPSMPHENSPSRKPGTGMLTEYFSDEYDLANSFVIGDRLTDIFLAKNLGAKGILLGTEDRIKEIEENGLTEVCALITPDWEKVYAFLSTKERKAVVSRQTNETEIHIEVDLDGSGKAQISTGLGFFDHMLDQIARHSGIDLVVKVKGDLHVDEHHTVEDTGIALGEALLKALGDKRGIERYGFVLPMDDCLAQVALDFGGRAWLMWETEFKREKIGDVPTEMFYHFFKSLSDAARMNLNIKAEGTNEHHKIEGIFKAFAKAIKNAIRRDVFSDALPSTKGVL